MNLIRFLIAGSVTLLGALGTLEAAPTPSPSSASSASSTSSSSSAAKKQKTTPQKSNTSSAKATSKTSAKTSSQKNTTTSASTKKAKVAAVAPVAVASLSSTELEIAQRVYTGKMACELGAHVELTLDQTYPGHFDVAGKGFKYRMIPVESRTGVIRLEDLKSGAVWLQMPHKSMLMNQKLGQRQADECMNEEQAKVAQLMSSLPPSGPLDPDPVPAPEPEPMRASTTTEPSGVPPQEGTNTAENRP